MSGRTHSYPGARAYAAATACIDGSSVRCERASTIVPTLNRYPAHTTSAATTTAAAISRTRGNRRCEITNTIAAKGKKTMNENFDSSANPIASPRRKPFLDRAKTKSARSVIDIAAQSVVASPACARTGGSAPKIAIASSDLVQIPTTTIAINRNTRFPTRDSARLCRYVPAAESPAK